MADIATLVERYLTIPAKSKRLNYYSVLGLEELIDDRIAIAVALESAIEHLKSADRTTDPAGFEQVVKVVRQARATLLDAEKKRAYDVQLKALLAKSESVANGNGRTASTPSRLSQLLPPGDPMTPFSKSEFQKHPTEQLEVETAAERHLALADLVKAADEDTKIETPEHVPILVSSAQNTDRPVAGRSSGRELQEKIRRNRRKKNLMATGIAVGGSLIGVLFGVYMFVSNRMEQNKRVAKVPNGPSLADAFQPNATDMVATNTEIVDGTDAASKPRMNLGVTPQSNENVGALPKLGAEDDPSTMSPLKSDTVVTDEPKPPEATNVPDVPKPPAMADETKKAMETDAAQTKWSEAMMAAKRMIVEKDFEGFGAEIEKALNLSGSDAREEQAKRLDKFGQLYQKGCEIVSEAFSELKATDEIKYGSAGGKASVVESSENLLILRISGKNERFTHDKIPMGILMAVIEPKLNQSAMDLVIRAILLSTGGRSNASTKSQAKILFEKAASMDESFSKLESVLDEKYQ